MAEAKKPKDKKTSKSTKYIQKDGKLERKNNFCPKCGTGVFMAQHKDRQTCGKCGFTQWTTKK